MRRALTDPAGALTDSYSYTAFGEMFAWAGSTVNPYLYTGQQFDAQTNLYSMRARFYDPVLGRFLTRDPVDFAVNNINEVNRYGYGATNPINTADPTGMQAFYEYSQENEESIEQEAALEEVGGGTADLATEQVADLYIEESRALWSQHIGGNRPITIAKGTYQAGGETRTIITVNNFYTEEAYLSNKPVVEGLKRYAQELGWEFEGGILESGATKETAMHAEQNLIRAIQELGVDANSRVPVGVSHTRGLCDRCLTLGQRIANGRGILKELGDGIRIIIMGR